MPNTTRTRSSIPERRLAGTRNASSTPISPTLPTSLALLLLVVRPLLLKKCCYVHLILSMLPGSKNADLDALISAQPRTKDDFTKLSSQIVEFIIKRHQSKPLYATFAEQLTRDIAEPLKDVEVRKVASALTTLANEKQKEARDKASGKKKKGGKPVLGGAKAVKAYVTSIFSCSPLTTTLPVPILVSTMKRLMISETTPMTSCNLSSLLA